MATALPSLAIAFVAHSAEPAAQPTLAIAFVAHSAEAQANLSFSAVMILHPLEPDHINVNSVLIEYAVGGSIPCAMAGLPAAYLVFPDPKLNRAGILSVTSEAGPYPGSTIAGGSNLGRLLPVQSGEYTIGAEDAVLLVKESGLAGKATYVWRNDADGADTYRGVDDPRYWWGFHDGKWAALLSSKNTSAAYHRATNRVLLYAGNNITSVGKIGVGYRQPDDRYDDWTFPGNTNTEKTFAAGDHGLAAVELPEGRIMLVQRVDGNAGGPTYDFDVYHSEDGITITNVASSIVERYDASTAAVHATAAQIRLAVSGEYIRLCFATTANNLVTYVSQDRGMSWKRLVDSNALPSPFTMANSGDADDPVPFDLVGVNDRGDFILFYRTGTYQVARQIAHQDEDWTVPGVLTFALLDTTLYVKTISMVRCPTYVWIFVYGYDADGVSGGEHEWMMLRVPHGGYLSLGNEWQRQNRSEQDGAAAYPGRLKTIWGGSQFVFWGSAKDETTGTDTTKGSCWLMGQWSNRSVGARPPSDSFASYQAKDLMQIWWVCQQLEPSVGALTTWTKATVGTGVATASQEYMTLTGSAAADAVNYSFVFGADNGWGTVGIAVVYLWEVGLDAGDSTHTAPDVGLVLKASDGVNQWFVTIQHGPATTRLIDSVAASTVADLAIVVDNGSAQLTRFRLAVAVVSGTLTAQIAAFDYATGLWVTASGAITTAAAAGTSVKFGHLGQTQGTQMRSYWREAAVMLESSNDAAGQREMGFVNPDDLMDQVCSPASSVPYQISNGIEVAWGGSGAAVGDTFDIDVAFVFGVEGMMTDSPRLAWRSGGADPQVAQTLIFDAGAVNGTAKTWTHDSIVVVGTTDREIVVDYDNDPAFGSPTAGGTVSMDAFGTGGVALAVSAMTATRDQEIDIDTTEVRFTKGELASTPSRAYYVRVTSGSAVGKTWKITEHPVLGKLVCGDEQSLIAQGLSAGDNLVVFADRGALVYAATVQGERYMRLRMLDTDTATGDHRLGAIVPNMHHPLTVPLEWAHTDNEQPNVTMYRTQGAVQWGYEEGPPQRTIISRIVGDASQRDRDQLRYQLRLAGYEVRPIGLVMDSLRPVDSVMYGRIVSGSQLDNAGYFQDSSGVIRAAGDLSFTFTEEP